MRYYTPVKIGEKQSKTPEGFLVCHDVVIATTGVLHYTPAELPFAPGEDGIITVYRDAPELFNPKTIDSLEGKPVVEGHPIEDVDPSNWANLAIGHIQNVHRGTGVYDDCLLADFVMTDEKGIALIQCGLREVSLGYTSDYERLGIGKQRQFNIVCNHVALVDQARGGPRCAIGDGTMAVSSTLVEKIWTAYRTRDAKALQEALKSKDSDPGEVTSRDESGNHTHVHVHLGDPKDPSNFSAKPANVAQGEDPKKVAAGDGQSVAAEQPKEEASAEPPKQEAQAEPPKQEAPADNGFEARFVALENAVATIAEALVRLTKAEEEETEGKKDGEEPKQEKEGEEKSSEEKAPEGTRESDAAEESKPGEEAEAEAEEGHLEGEELEDDGNNLGGSKPEPTDEGKEVAEKDDEIIGSPDPQEEDGSDKAKKQRTGDGTSIASTVRQVFAKAEMLAPGIAFPTYDSADPLQTEDILHSFRVRTLKDAWARHNRGYEAIRSILGDKTFSLKHSTRDAVTALFDGAAELVRQAAGKPSLASITSSGSNGPPSIKDLNSYYKNFWSKH